MTAKNTLPTSPDPKKEMRWAAIVRTDETKPVGPGGFQVTLSCQFRAIIAVKLHAATPEEAEKKAFEFAGNCCQVDEIPAGDRDPEFNPECEPLVSSICTSAETITVEPTKYYGVFNVTEFERLNYPQ